MKPIALIHTLGCRLNTADTALLVTRLEAAGYRVAAPNDPALPAAGAALVVINSCAVTGEAARKSRQAARRFRSEHPKALIVVTGCGAEIDSEAFQTEGAADVVLPNPGKKDLPALILEFLAERSVPPTPQSSELPGGGAFREEAVGRFPFHSRGFIKIQEGCDNFCSYCIVPYARGRERSRAFEEVLADCRNAVASGLPEVILTGVNTCAYQDGGHDLCGLIRAVAALPGDFRIRLSSTEPAPDSFELIDVMASEPKVCRFLHLALQHGSDRVLTAMNRRYTAAQYARFAAYARARIPGIHLGSDLIVGFPGETAEEFAESARFVEEMAFANLHVFTYSPREGTPAAALPGRIPAAVAKERYRRMQSIAAASKRNFIAGQYGQTLPVIFERIDAEGRARGWSDNYIELRIPAAEARLDCIMDVKAGPENISVPDAPLSQEAIATSSKEEP